MDKFVFTPGQREEALSWYKKNCYDFYVFLTTIKEAIKIDIQDLAIDIYFKLKDVSLPLEPNQFIIGIEYKDQKKVTLGNEPVNIAFHNPSRVAKKPCDPFARAVLMNLLTKLQVP